MLNACNCVRHLFRHMKMNGTDWTSSNQKSSSAQLWPATCVWVGAFAWCAIPFSLNTRHTSSKWWATVRQCASEAVGFCLPRKQWASARRWVDRSAINLTEVVDKSSRWKNNLYWRISAAAAAHPRCIHFVIAYGCHEISAACLSWLAHIRAYVLHIRAASRTMHRCIHDIYIQIECYPQKHNKNALLMQKPKPISWILSRQLDRYSVNWNADYSCNVCIIRSGNGFVRLCSIHFDSGPRTHEMSALFQEPNARSRFVLFLHLGSTK